MVPLRKVRPPPPSTSLGVLGKAVQLFAVNTQKSLRPLPLSAYMLTPSDARLPPLPMPPGVPDLSVPVVAPDSVSCKLTNCPPPYR